MNNQPFSVPSQSSKVAHQEFGMQYNDVLSIRQDNDNREGTRPDDDVDPRIVSKCDSEDIGVVVQKMVVLYFPFSAESRSGNGMPPPGLEKEARCPDGYWNGV